MLALEAIFEDKICIFGEKAGPRSFQVKLFKLVHRVPGISNYHRHTKIMMLPFPFSIICRSRCIVKFQSITVTVEPFQGDDDDPKSQFLENFSVEHLAPLSLTCLMPPSYPSHHPPYFTLGVQWLDNVKVSSLCHMLDSIWAQQAEQEVVYEWVH